MHFFSILECDVCMQNMQSYINLNLCVIWCLWTLAPSSQAPKLDGLLLESIAANELWHGPGTVQLGPWLQKRRHFKNCNVTTVHESSLCFMWLGDCAIWINDVPTAYQHEPYQRKDDRITF